MNSFRCLTLAFRSAGRSSLLGLTIAALACNPGLCLGQSTTAVIQGSIHDPSNAVLPNADVTAINTQTNEAHTVKSTASGDFVIPNLPVGEYRVEATAPGFKKALLGGLELTVNAAVRVDLTMAVGAQSESVEVSDIAPLVNTYTSELGQTVENRRVEELPLNGRNVYGLFQTLPGVSRTSIPTVQSRDNNNVSFNGQRPGTSNFLLDGGFNNDIWRNQGNSGPNPDAVQEFAWSAPMQARSSAGSREQSSTLLSNLAPINFMGPSTSSCATTTSTQLPTFSVRSIH